MSEPYWVPLSGAAVSDDLPIGSVIAWYSDTIPAGWLLCDGSPVPGAYADLIAVIGANTPDLRGRVLVGRSPGGKPEVDALGDSDGLAANLRNISHSHTFVTYDGGSPPGSPPASNVNSNLNPRGTRTQGDADNSNAPAYLVANYIIKATFVSRPPTVYTGTTPVVTTLPGAPVDGDEVILVDSLTNPTFSWRMVFLASVAKWMYIGGPPAQIEVATAEGTNATSYINLATVGPSFTTPCAGDWAIGTQFKALNTGTEDTASMSFATGASDASEVEANRMPLRANSTGSNGVYWTRKKAVAASTAIVAKYKSSNGQSFSFSERRLLVHPVMLG